VYKKRDKARICDISACVGICGSVFMSVSWHKTGNIIAAVRVGIHLKTDVKKSQCESNGGEWAESSVRTLMGNSNI